MAELALVIGRDEDSQEKTLEELGSQPFILDVVEMDAPENPCLYYPHNECDKPSKNCLNCEVCDARDGETWYRF